MLTQYFFESASRRYYDEVVDPARVPRCHETEPPRRVTRQYVTLKNTRVDERAFVRRNALIVERRARHRAGDKRILLDLNGRRKNRLAAGV